LQQQILEELRGSSNSGAFRVGVRGGDEF